MAINAVPIIDLAAFEHGDSNTRAEIARLTDEACRHTGFLAIAHHGVDQNVIDTMWNTMQEFFDLPTSVKQQFNVPFPGYPYGYMGNEAETLAASRGNTTPPDLKETFDFFDFPAAVLVTTSDDFFAFVLFVFATACFTVFPLGAFALAEIFCFASPIDSAMFPRRSLSSIKVCHISVMAKPFLLLSDRLL